MNKEIRDLIEQFDTDNGFTHSEVTDKMLMQATEELQVVLPDQFCDFIKIYGYGGIGGMVILGVGLDGSLVFVDETVDYRKYGLPENYVVIEDCDEWVYCIDCQTEKIVSWSLDGFVQEEYDCFDSFLLERLREVTEDR